jgi:uncharacterized Zn finger protein (UPF0148 family)
MNGQCLKCGAHLAQTWRFCPHCGAEAPPEIEAKVPSGEAENAPVQGAFGGLLFGLLVVPILIVVGTLLCLTGLGAFLGVPLIIGAVLAPLLGPLIGIGVLRGKCPWCGTPVNSVVKNTEFYCHVCNRKIALQNRRFIKVE